MFIVSLVLNTKHKLLWYYQNRNLKQKHYSSMIKIVGFYRITKIGPRQYRSILAAIKAYFVRTQEVKHKKYVEIKQIPKVDIKQNNITCTTVILLIKFLIYQLMRSAPFARKSRFLHVCLHNESVFYLISNHIKFFLYTNH